MCSGKPVMIAIQIEEAIQTVSKSKSISVEQRNPPSEHMRSPSLSTMVWTSIDDGRLESLLFSLSLFLSECGFIPRKTYPLSHQGWHTLAFKIFPIFKSMLFVFDCWIVECGYWYYQNELKIGNEIRDKQWSSSNRVITQTLVRKLLKTVKSTYQWL